MKKWLSLLLAAVLTLSLAACGGAPAETSGNAESTADTSGSTASADSIRLVNGKIEVDAALKKLAAMYKEETGVDVSIES
ncbi:MAG: carbohydrate ABC transporter substrate-binding protein, partial [Oscillibacter sp.]|nr:carbohydrate ABC transporter substrate-binding protein [Oscillibacter sp.]